MRSQTEFGNEGYIPIVIDSQVAAGLPPRGASTAAKCLSHSIDLLASLTARRQRERIEHELTSTGEALSGCCEALESIAAPNPRPG
jgi:hypothetical protein